MAPTVTVTVATGQRVHVSSHKYMGAGIFGASDLDTAVCYQSTGGGALVIVGAEMLDGQVPGSTRIPWGITAIITPAAGTYNTGLCARSSAPGNWNNNEWGYTSAMVFQP